MKGESLSGNKAKTLAMCDRMSTQKQQGHRSDPDARPLEAALPQAVEVLMTADKPTPGQPSGQVPNDTPVLSAFACRVVGYDHETVVNAESTGKAKVYFQHHSLYDLDVPFTAIRVRRIGRAHTSDDFARVAKMRGVPSIKCGDLCTVAGVACLIQGHNSSANFDVLFLGGRYQGQVLNVHPSSIQFNNSADPAVPND